MRNLYLEKKAPCSNRYPPNFFDENAGREAAPLRADRNTQKSGDFWEETGEPKVYEWLLKRFIANRIQ